MAENGANVAGFAINIDIDDFIKKMDEYHKGITNMQNETEKSTSSVEGAFGKMQRLAMGYLSATALMDFTKQVINIRGQFQQLEIAFGTMLGSQEKAVKLMDELKETALKTTFEMTDIAQGAKQLLAYGTASEEVNETLVRLGNIASGLSIPLNDLVYLYGTTQTQGRLFTQDVRQFMGRGIPLVKELSKELGKTETEINAMVTAGQIGFKEVEKVIKNMTNEGGMFYQLMEKQLASLTGQISNLQDAWDSMLNEIGQVSQDALSSGISAVAYLVENYKTLGKAIAEIAVVYGTYKSAMALSMAWESRAMLLTQAHTKLIKLQTIAQTALNAVSKLNPYVAIGATIAGLVASIALWKDNTDALTQAQTKLNEEMGNFTSEQEQRDEKTKQYIAIVQDETKAVYEQVSAYQELQKYKNVAQGKSIEEVRGLTGSQIGESMAVQNYNSQLDELKRKAKEANDELVKMYGSQEKVDSVLKNKRDGSGLNYETGKAKDDINTILAVEQEINRMTTERAKIEKQAQYERLSNEEKIKHNEEEIAKLSEKRAKQDELLKRVQGGDSFGYDERQIRKQIDFYDKQIEERKKLNDSLNKADAEQTKNYVYWEKEKEKATNDFHNAVAYTKPYYDAKARMEEAEKEMAKWKDVTDKTRQSLEDLEAQLAQMRFDREQEESTRGKQGFELQLQETQNEYEAKLKELDLQREEMLKQAGGNKEAIAKIEDEYIKQAYSLSVAKGMAFAKVTEEQKKYIADMNAELGEYYKTSYQNEIDAINKWAKEQTDKLIGNVTNEEERKRIEKLIEDERKAKIEDVDVNKSLDQEKKVLAVELERLDATKMIRGEQETEYMKLKARESSLKRQIDYIKNQKENISEVEKQTMGDLEEELSSVQTALMEAEKSAVKLSDTISGTFANLGQMISNSSNEMVSSIGGYMQQLSSAYENVKEIKADMAKGDKASAYTNAFSSVATFAYNTFETIYSQAQSNKQALESWNQTLADSEHKLAMLRIDEAQYQSPNIWGSDDPYNKISALLKQSNIASEETAKAVTKLQKEGIVQVGWRNKVNGKSTAELALAGTGAGAAVGSVVGPIGTAIGAAVGAIAGGLIGLFATKEKVAVYDTLSSKYGQIYDRETLEINKQILADYDKMDDATKKLIDNAKELLEAQKQAYEEMEGVIAEMTGDLAKSYSDALVNAFSNGDVYTAVDDLHDYVENTLESLISSTIFNNIFADKINDLSDRLIQDAKEGSDFNYTLMLYSTELKQGLSTYDKAMKAMQDALKDSGFYLFQAEDNVAQTQEALKNTIASQMTEDTATQLNGNFNGLKISAVEISSKMTEANRITSNIQSIVERSLQAINRIADNTEYNRNLERLTQLADDIRDIKNEGLTMK